MFSTLISSSRIGLPIAKHPEESIFRSREETLISRVTTTKAYSTAVIDTINKVVEIVIRLFLYILSFFITRSKEQPIQIPQEIKRPSEQPIQIPQEEVPDGEILLSILDRTWRLELVIDQWEITESKRSPLLCPWIQSFDLFRSSENPDAPVRDETWSDLTTVVLPEEVGHEESSRFSRYEWETFVLQSGIDTPFFFRSKLPLPRNQKALIAASNRALVPSLSLFSLSELFRSCSNAMLRVLSSSPRYERWIPTQDPIPQPKVDTPFFVSSKLPLPRNQKALIAAPNRAVIPYFSIPSLVECFFPSSSALMMTPSFFPLLKASVMTVRQPVRRLPMNPFALIAGAAFALTIYSLARAKEKEKTPEITDIPNQKEITPVVKQPKHVLFSAPVFGQQPLPLFGSLEIQNLSIRAPGPAIATIPSIEDVLIPSLIPADDVAENRSSVREEGKFTVPLLPREFEPPPLSPRKEQNLSIESPQAVISAISSVEDVPNLYRSSAGGTPRWPGSARSFSRAPSDRTHLNASSSVGEREGWDRHLHPTSPSTEMGRSFNPSPREENRDKSPHTQRVPNLPFMRITERLENRRNAMTQTASTPITSPRPPHMTHRNPLEAAAVSRNSVGKVAPQPKRSKVNRDFTSIMQTIATKFREMRKIDATRQKEKGVRSRHQEENIVNLLLDFPSIKDRVTANKSEKIEKADLERALETYRQVLEKELPWIEEKVGKMGEQEKVANSTKRELANAIKQFKELRPKDKDPVVPRLSLIDLPGRNVALSGLASSLETYRSSMVSIRSSPCGPRSGGPAILSSRASSRFPRPSQVSVETSTIDLKDNDSKVSSQAKAQTEESVREQKGRLSRVALKTTSRSNNPINPLGKIETTIRPNQSKVPHQSRDSGPRLPQVGPVAKKPSNPLKKELAATTRPAPRSVLPKPSKKTQLSQLNNYLEERKKKPQGLVYATTDIHFLLDLPQTREKVDELPSEDQRNQLSTQIEKCEEQLEKRLLPILNKLKSMPGEQRSFGNIPNKEVILKGDEFLKSRKARKEASLPV